jgi:hypothetical protein
MEKSLIPAAFFVPVYLGNKYSANVYVENNRILLI